MTGADRVDLAEAQRLADEATPGPWRWTARGIEGGENNWTDVLVGGSVDCMTYCYGGSSTLEMDNADADAQFLVAARSLVPALVAELVGLREATDRIRQAGEKIERAVFDAWVVREGNEPTADSSWWHIHKSGPTHTKWAADAALGAVLAILDGDPK